jgi:uncharacterized protein DUF5681
MPFEKGESGNAAGRPLGSRNRKTLLLEAMLEGEAEQLARRLIEKAMQGDFAALRHLVDRVMPGWRDRPVAFPLPELAKRGGIARAVDEISGGIGAGTLSTREGLELVRYLERSAQALKAGRELEKATHGGRTEVVYRWQTEEEAAQAAAARAGHKGEKEQ